METPSFGNLMPTTTNNRDIQFSAKLRFYQNGGLRNMRKTAALIAFERILPCSLVTHSRLLACNMPMLQGSLPATADRSGELAPRFQCRN
jgi:hypothetical protein